MGRAIGRRAQAVVLLGAQGHVRHAKPGEDCQLVRHFAGDVAALDEPPLVHQGAGGMVEHRVDDPIGLGLPPRARSSAPSAGASSAASRKPEDDVGLIGQLVGVVEGPLPELAAVVDHTGASRNRGCERPLDHGQQELAVLADQAVVAGPVAKVAQAMQQLAHLVELLAVGRIEAARDHRRPLGVIILVRMRVRAARASSKWPACRAPGRCSRCRAPTAPPYSKIPASIVPSSAIIPASRSGPCRKAAWTVRSSRGRRDGGGDPRLAARRPLQRGRLRRKPLARAGKPCRCTGRDLNEKQGLHPDALAPGRTIRGPISSAAPSSSDTGLAGRRAGGQSAMAGAAAASAQRPSPRAAARPAAASGAAARSPAQADGRLPAERSDGRPRWSRGADPTR